MNSEFNNYQTDWLAQTEELKDIEASKVNGGIGSVGGGAEQAGGAGGAEQEQQKLGELLQKLQGELAAKQSGAGAGA
jgi:hypothetical protein